MSDNLITTDLPGTPKSLFKYFPRDRIHSFASCCLRFSPLSAFNDPFEGRPEIRGFIANEKLQQRVYDSLPQELRIAYQKLQPEQKALISEGDFVQSAMALSPSTVPALLRSFAPSILELAKSIPDRLDGLLGALCLCENRDSLLMWAHYASSHTGFLAEYKTDHPYLSARRTPSDEFYHPRRVEYRHERPSAELFELEGLELFLVKSRHWEYECEWRVLKPLADADQVLPSAHGQIHLFRYPPEMVQSITMGARCSDADLASMRSVLSSDPGFSRTRLLKARPHSSRFELEFEEIGP